MDTNGHFSGKKDIHTRRIVHNAHFVGKKGGADCVIGAN